MLNYYLAHSKINSTKDFSHIGDAMKSNSSFIYVTLDELFINNHVSVCRSHEMRINNYIFLAILLVEYTKCGKNNNYLVI